ncbi:endonuclease-reverse transcriptase [Elysia marginata]|uniref:Endonuclease-reverse transcriptase n=1 Tax=Elysia marginata TaxID=1093978 RepID=A0AAV4HNE6_9GAST|nr:endonuclease-reverse transcriptase [Elysia marginata]
MASRLGLPTLLRHRPISYPHKVGANREEGAPFLAYSLISMFKATKVLNQKHFENPKVEDREGKLATRPNDILEIVSSHFKNKFQDEKAEMISPFQGEPKPLEKPITPEEVRKSFNSLINNKAPGEDEIHAELLKYGTPLLDQTIADI